MIMNKNRNINMKRKINIKMNIDPYTVKDMETDKTWTGQGHR
jgi:DNA-binding protein H-NS